MAELVEGFEFLTGLIDDVTVLGTKDVKPESEFYQAARTWREISQNETRGRDRRRAWHYGSRERGRV